MQELKRQRGEEYNKNPRLCPFCSTPISYENKKKGNRYCSHSCAAKFNNPLGPRNPKIDKLCLNCNSQLNNTNNQYCNLDCHIEHKYQLYIEAWKNGTIIGLNKDGTVTSTIKKYLRKKYSNKCIICGWSKLNPYTNIVPLVADHIDGNWQNNTEGNLRLICPSCDSLTSTYCGANRGNGRSQRLKKQNPAL